MWHDLLNPNCMPPLAGFPRRTRTHSSIRLRVRDSIEQGYVGSTLVAISPNAPPTSKACGPYGSPASGGGSPFSP